MIIVDGQKIIPAPFASISVVTTRNSDGKPIGKLFNITLEGTFLPNKGSPTSSGTFWTQAGYPPDETISETSLLTTILNKQAALQKIFNNDGLTLEIQGADGAAPLKCNPRVKGPIDFRRGNLISWAHKCDYVINLEADVVYIGSNTLGNEFNDNGSYYIENFSEEWNIEPADEFARTFRLTRAVSAKGKRSFDETGALTGEAWQNASGYVLNILQLGIDNARLVATGVLNNSDNFQAYNYVRAQNINETEGTFRVNETWLCFTPSGSPAIEEFDVNSRTGEGNVTTVSIQGTIRGLEARNNTNRTLTSTRWQNASGYWSAINTTLFNRAENITGLDLNPVLLGKTVGYNENNGVITYNYEYNNRPLPITNGALTERIVVGYEGIIDVYAQIPVIGRPLGPIFQPIGTVTPKRKTLNIDITVEATKMGYTATMPDTDIIRENHKPTGDVVAKTRDTISVWDEYSGRYSRNVEWLYE